VVVDVIVVDEEVTAVVLVLEVVEVDVLEEDVVAADVLVIDVVDGLVLLVVLVVVFWSAFSSSPGVVMPIISIAAAARSIAKPSILSSAIFQLTYFRSVDLTRLIASTSFFCFSRFLE
jgi:hypothetical protein